jgi:hypothetical protein
MGHLSQGERMPYKMRGKTFDEFVVDEEIVSGARTVSEAYVVRFAYLSGDFHPQHMNKEYGGSRNKLPHAFPLVSADYNILWRRSFAPIIYGLMPCGFTATSEAKKGLKGSHRLFSPIVR